LEVLLIIVLLCCSGAISGSETALFALDRQMLRRFRRSTHRLEQLAVRLMEHPRRVLMTVLIANTTVNVAVFAVSYVASRQVEPGAAGALRTALSGVVTLMLVILCGEILPKAVAYTSADRFAPFAAVLIFVLQTVLAPLRWLFGVALVTPLTRLLTSPAPAPSAVDVDELQFLVDQSAREGVIDSRENQMLQALVALPDVRVRDIMVPRVDIESVSVNEPPRAIRRILRQTHRRKVPVYRRDPDDIVGLLYARDAFLNPHAATEALLRPVHFVPEQADLGDLIRHFKQTRTQLAIVVDEYGGTAGLVTVEDVLEEIVGDISEADQPPQQPPVEAIDRNTYRVLGDLSIRAWKSRFAVGRLKIDVNTVGGLLLAMLGRVPREGDRVRVHNLFLTVDRMRGRRVESVIIQRQTAPAPERGQRP